MQNWRDYVDEQDECALHIRIKDPSADFQSVVLVIDKTYIECTLTEQQVGEVVEKALLSFPPAPVFMCDPYTRHPKLIIERVANEIARNSLRGVGNTRWKNVLWYKGESKDSPIVVVKHNKKFGVFKHPDFDKYGFVLPEELTIEFDAK